MNCIIFWLRKMTWGITTYCKSYCKKLLYEWFEEAKFPKSEQVSVTPNEQNQAKKGGHYFGYCNELHQSFLNVMYLVSTLLRHRPDPPSSYMLVRLLLGQQKYMWDNNYHGLSISCVECSLYQWPCLVCQQYDRYIVPIPVVCRIANLWANDW
jgi:hypothetical protein